MPRNTPKPYRSCRHILSNGERCGSPRMHERDFCYFHHRTHAKHQTAIEGSKSNEIMLPVLDKNGALLGMEPAPQQSFDLGLLEDRTSVQIALSTVLNALASGHLDQRRANSLLYGLQLAIACFPGRRDEPSPFKLYVTDVALTPEGIPIVPSAD